MSNDLNNKDIRTVAIIFVIALVIVVGVLFWASRGMAQGKEYKLTEVQLLKLQVEQKDAQLLQAQLQNVQRQFQEKVSELMSTANKFKLENGWPPETQFDPDKLVFSAPPEKGDKK